MWEIIANIASVCSIIGLPIALWQIYGLKSKVEATEKGIKSVLDIKEHEKFMESDMQNNAELKESRDYLNNAIQQMKQEQKVFDDKAISIAAHSND